VCECVCVWVCVCVCEWETSKHCLAEASDSFEVKKDANETDVKDKTNDKSFPIFPTKSIIIFLRQ